MTMRSTIRTAALVALALTGLAHAAATQPMGSGPPNALQGFSVNRDKPIRITSTSLEVRDKEKRATFIGNVLVAQGDTTMKSKTLDVFYDGDSDGTDGKAAAAAQTGPGEQTQIRRLEAKGGVVVSQKDQTATGETGVFEMRTNTVTLNGNVVITQGPQVIRGERLTVDLTSGVSHLEGSARAPVQALFLPNQARAKAGEKPDSKAGEKPDSKAGEKPDSKAADNSDSRESRPEGRKDAPKSNRSAPGQPMKLN
jgi:lipopolysaccharide export system protein LptA